MPIVSSLGKSGWIDDCLIQHRWCVAGSQRHQMMVSSFSNIFRASQGGFERNLTDIRGWRGFQFLMLGYLGPS
ncbi:hypothetical protein PGT21_032823 [Puccinia graminis f. sp. tritici]|uniref:Uncharacterized protein n=1 Tax=Puccinia graminis f. sp. tritici TaxID=56615 RepID=A0A5B0P472_PUCGR|nr:hypothetical protein PGTUg99_005779 [Puccinia graminis f. sp. tritici]KAA1094918.1 hypothetical protein PGT21_032823 [Puccinia graminis f. sp. tritici]